jgi:sugar lactone lactonase YvrE
MKMKIILAFVFCLVVSTLGFGQSGLLAGEREYSVAGIPGIVDAGAEWQLVWADFETADGIVGTPDGGVLFAQEQTDTIRRLNADDEEFVFLTDTNGAGSVSVDTQGRVYSVQRACTDSAIPFYESCQEMPRVAMMYPEYRVLANSFPDGRRLGRVNDLIADGKGGAYFTVGGLYYAPPDGGEVYTVANQNIRTNGLMLSSDGETLYVTNGTEVVAFDVLADGTTRNRRVFGTLDGDNGGDGMAIDSEDRLYVTGNGGVHVLSADGEHLGVIETPRRPITMAFSGPNKQTIYVPMMGAVGPDGQPWTTPEGVRNTGMTIYKMQMLSQGFTGRPK